MKLMPRVTISGWTRNTPTPMPVDEAGQRGGRERDAIPSTKPPGLLISVAVTNPTIDATAPTDRSMPPVSIVSVWQPARIASGIAVRRMTAAQLGETIPGAASWITTTGRTSRPMSGTIGRSRNSARTASEARPFGRCRSRRSRPSPSDLERLPSMTTPMRIAPWATRAKFESTRRKVRSVWISCRMTTATIGPKTPPRPPARLTPPRTTAATLSSVYGPGTGEPMPRAGGQRQPGEGREQAGEHVGENRVRPTGTPLRKAASRSLPMA